MLCSLSASAYLQRPSLNTTSFPPFWTICRRPPYTPDSIDRSYKSYDGSSIPRSKSALRARYQSLPSYLHQHITIPQPEPLSFCRPSGHFSTLTRSEDLLLSSSYLTTLYTPFITMCDYTQREYSCGHFRWIASRWCRDYTLTHKRCQPNVTHFEYRYVSAEISIFPEHMLYCVDKTDN